MIAFIRRRTPALFAIALFSAVSFACGGGSSIQGTYTNAQGIATLDLKSGGQATFTAMGETRACTYKVESSKLTLTCKGEDALEFTVHEDGSLASIGTFLGTMTKSKS